jgi:transposase
MGEAQLVVWVAEGRSLEQIGRQVGRHASTVACWPSKYGLSAPGRVKHDPWGPITREQLEALVSCGASIAGLAERLGRGTSTVRHWLKRYELETVSTIRRRAVNQATTSSFEMECRQHGITIFPTTA